jgi:hypothetical protein
MRCADLLECKPMRRSGDYQPQSNASGYRVMDLRWHDELELHFGPTHGSAGRPDGRESMPGRDDRNGQLEVRSVLTDIDPTELQRPAFLGIND